MHGVEGLLAGDDHALAFALADHAVGGHGKFQGDVRPPFRYARYVARMDEGRLVGEDSSSDGDASCLEGGMSLAARARVGIGHGGHDAGDPRLDERAGARAPLAPVSTGFQRDVSSRICSGLTGHRDRLPLGMRTASDGGPAAADDQRRRTICPHNHASDGGILAGLTEISSPKPDGRRHHPAVKLLIYLRFLPFRHQPGPFRASAPSPLSSPSAALKSSESLKFR